MIGDSTLLFLTLSSSFNLWQWTLALCRRCFKPSLVLEIKIMLSAKNKPWMVTFPILNPSVMSESSCPISEMYRAKRIGEMEQPCLNPLLGYTGLVYSPKIWKCRKLQNDRHVAIWSYTHGLLTLIYAGFWGGTYSRGRGLIATLASPFQGKIKILQPFPNRELKRKKNGRTFETKMAIKT